jgi:hypothetical protein
MDRVGMDTVAERVAERVLTAGDITVHDVEIASDQEVSIDNGMTYGEGFVVLMRADFTVKGRTLAKILRKQQRVLGRFLEKATERQLLNAIGDSREVLKAVSPKIKWAVYDYIQDEFPGEDPPRRMEAVWTSDEGDLPYRAKADPRTESVRVEMEFDLDADF